MTEPHEPNQGLLGRLGARWTQWRATRDARPEFVKASQARIWRITSVSILAVVGLVAAVLAVLSNSSTVSRLSADETCLRSVVAAQNARSSVLSGLSKRRTDADDRRQAWNTAEQRAFAEALTAKTTADRRKVRRDFTRALNHYLAADAHYRRLNTLYNRAQQAHPVPKLQCTAGRLDAPAPTVIVTPSPSISVRISKVPGPVRISKVPGPMRIVPGRTITTTAPRGKGRGRHHGR